MNTTKFYEGYEKMKTVGQGSFGTATLYRRIEDGRLVILKEVFTFNMDSSERKSALNEVEILSTLNHSNIIRYIGNFQKEESLIIIMEYADAGNLAQLINFKKRHNEPFIERSILNILLQITSAIAYMHGKKILHRDLKTANIFLNRKGIVQVGDFGISKMLNTLSQAQTVVGTPYYLSPEMCEGNDYNEKSDIWAIGCILYELSCLRKPFEAITLPVLVQKITTCQYEDIPDIYSKDLAALVRSILQKNATLRPSAKYMCETAVPKIIKKCQNLQPGVSWPVLGSSKEKDRSILYKMTQFGMVPEIMPIELPNKKIIDFDVSPSHQVTVTSDNKVYVCGKNEFGQLGLGNTIQCADPIHSQHLNDHQVIRCGVGRNFSIFLTQHGTLYSCGDGIKGCLGHGDWNCLLSPTIIQVLANTNIKQLCCGDEHVVALSSEGKVFTWGSSENGQLGQGHNQRRCKPLAIYLPTQPKIKSIYCGSDATALVTMNGRVLVSGGNVYKKLGMLRPDKINVFTILKNIKEKIRFVSLGLNHTAMLCENGSLITMGRNLESQLGKGTIINYNQPQTVKWQNKITMVACGVNYTVAADNRNVLWFWGSYNKPQDKPDFQKSFCNNNTVLDMEIQEKIMKDSQLTALEVARGVAKNPQSILALHASSQNIKAERTIHLGDIKCGIHNLYVIVHTTCPPPLKPFNYTLLQNENYMTQNQSTSDTRSLSTELPNTAM